MSKTEQTSSRLVLVADDHALVRRGIVEMVRQFDPETNIIEAGEGDTALEFLKTSHPDIAILDVDMPKMNGLELAAMAVRLELPVAVVILTMHDDPQIFRRALALGVKGYLLKDGAEHEVIACLNAISLGGYYYSPSMSKYMAREPGNLDERSLTHVGLSSLTPTERLILRMVSQNKTSREIAGELFISAKTVENHRSNICSKLGIKGANALLRFVIEHKNTL